MSTFERRIKILYCLCRRREDTIENLATEFSVADSKIRADIQALSKLFPVYTVQGKGGGVRIMEGYRLGQKLNAVQQSWLEGVVANGSEKDAKIARSILRDCGTVAGGEL